LNDIEYEQLVEWIASDWDISKKQAMDWIKKHIDFLRDYERLQVKETPCGLPINEWISKFFYAGRPTVIVAPNGEGKTYFASWIIRKAMIQHKNWVFLSNIPFYFFDSRFKELRPPNLFQVKSLSEVLMIVANNILKKYNTVLVLDETEHFSSSHNWRDSNWIAFINISRHLLIRGPLLIYHATNLIPYEIRSGQIGNQIMPIMIQNGKRYIANFSTKPHVLEISSSDPIFPYSHLGWGGFNPNIDVIQLERDIVQIDIREAAKIIIKNLNKYIIGERTVLSELSEKRRQAVLKRWKKKEGLQNDTKVSA